MDSTQKILHAKCGGFNVEDVEELNLNDCEELNEKLASLSVYNNLQVLHLDNVGITSLNSFPSLANLKILSLRNNKLSSDITPLSRLPSLTHLDLSGNSIARIDVLRPLEELTLKKLDLVGCPVTKTPDYRSIVFDVLHKLKVLDGLSYNEVEGGENTNEDNSENRGNGEKSEKSEKNEKNGQEGQSENKVNTKLVQTHNSDNVLEEDRGSENGDENNDDEETDIDSEEFDENANQQISEIAKLLAGPIPSEESDSEGSDFQLNSGSEDEEEEDDEYNVDDEDENENDDEDDDNDDNNATLEKLSHSVGDEETQEDSQKGSAPSVWSGDGTLKRKSNSFGDSSQFSSSKKRSR